MDIFDTRMKLTLTDLIDVVARHEKEIQELKRLVTPMMEFKREKLEQEPVAWMVYNRDGESVYVTDNPTDIQEGQRALPLYTSSNEDYMELIMAVENKYPGESRHNTALRYIRDREGHKIGAAKEEKIGVCDE